MRYLQMHGGEAPIGPLTRANGTPLSGYEWEEIEGSIEQLRARHIIHRGPFDLWIIIGE